MENKKETKAVKLLTFRVLKNGKKYIIKAVDQKEAELKASKL